MRAFLDSLPTTRYGNIDCTDESVLQTLKDNGFVFVARTDDDGRTYTGKQGFFGMDDSSVGRTEYSRSARPELRDITFDGLLPECNPEEQIEKDAEVQHLIWEYSDSQCKATITSISYIQGRRYKIISSTPILVKNSDWSFWRIKRNIDGVWTEVDEFEYTIRLFL